MGDKQGSVLIVSYLVASVVLTLGTTFLLRATTEQRASERSRSHAAAFYLAEAGIDRAIAQLQADSGWTGEGYTPLTVGGYSVSVSSLNATTKQITASGYYPSNAATAANYHTRGIVAAVTIQPRGSFDYAAFASGTIRVVSGGLIDSYDSRQGSYSRTNRGEDGDVGSNSTAPATIKVSTAGLIKGDAAVGPGAEVNTAIVTTHPRFDITGRRQRLDNIKTLAPKPFPSGRVTEALCLAGGRTRKALPAGTYRFSRVDLAASATVTVTGDVTMYVEGDLEITSAAQLAASCATCTVTIYVKGDVTLASGGTLSAAKPDKLTVYKTGTGEVTMASGGKLYGAVHAPTAHVTIASAGKVYGAIIGQRVTVASGGALHYDVALKQGGAAAGGPGAQVLSWHEP